MNVDNLDPTLERLHKVLARAGVASRRASEELIKQGRVAVNDRVVRELGTKTGPKDVITVDGKPVALHVHKVYLMLNKPRGYVTTVSDEMGRPTVMHLVPSEQRLYPVGRLDADSEGLLLLTNDGDLAYRLTHPRHVIEKEYHVLVAGNPTEQELQMLRRGVVLDERLTAPAVVERLPSEGLAPIHNLARKESGPAPIRTLSRSESGPEVWLRVVIHEGRKRQIRRMIAHVGYTVQRIIRVRVGPLKLGNLPSGRSRPLTQTEVAALFRAL